MCLFSFRNLFCDLFLLLFSVVVAVFRNSKKEERWEGRPREIHMVCKSTKALYKTKVQSVQFYEALCRLYNFHRSLHCTLQCQTGLDHTTLCQTVTAMVSYDLVLHDLYGDRVFR